MVEHRFRNAGVQSSILWFGSMKTKEVRSIFEMLISRRFDAGFKIDKEVILRDFDLAVMRSKS